MKRRYRVIVSALLAAVMTVQTLPLAAFAARPETPPDFDPALVEELTPLCEGEDFDAEDILTALYDAGLVDKKGELKTDATFLVVENGGKPEEMTNEELRKAAVERDENAVVTVDGIETTWGEMQKLIRYLDILFKLRTLADSDVPLTEEHIENIGKFAEALQNGEILVEADGDEASLSADEASLSAADEDGVDRSNRVYRNSERVTIDIIQDDASFSMLEYLDSQYHLRTALLNNDWDAITSIYGKFSVDMDDDIYTVEKPFTLSSIHTDPDTGEKYVWDDLDGKSSDVTKRVAALYQTEGLTIEGDPFMDGLNDRLNELKAFMVPEGADRFVSTVPRENYPTFRDDLEARIERRYFETSGDPDYMDFINDTAQLSVDAYDLKFDKDADFDFARKNTFEDYYNVDHWQDGDGNGTLVIKDIRLLDSGVFHDGDYMRILVDFAKPLEVVCLKDLSFTGLGDVASFPLATRQWQGTGWDHYLRTIVYSPYGYGEEDSAMDASFDFRYVYSGWYVESMIVKAPINSDMDYSFTGFDGQNYLNIQFDPENPAFDGVSVNTQNYGSWRRTFTLVDEVGNPTSLHITETVDGKPYRYEEVDVEKHLKDDLINPHNQFIINAKTNQREQFRIPVYQSDPRFFRWVCLNTELFNPSAADGDPYLRSLYCKIGPNGKKMPVKVKMKDTPAEYTSLSGDVMKVDECPDYLYIELEPGRIDDCFSIVPLHFYGTHAYDSADFFDSDAELPEIEADHTTYLQPPCIVLHADDLAIVYGDGWQSLAAEGIGTPDVSDIEALDMKELFASDKKLELTYDITSVGDFYNTGASFFNWVSSDESIATVETAEEDYTWNGLTFKRLRATVTPQGPGTVRFTLINQMPQGGVAAKVTSSPLTILEPEDPYLIVPKTSQTVYTRQGYDTNVSFNSNISKRNTGLYSHETTFTLNLYLADASGSKTGSPLYTGTMTVFDSKPAYTMQIPGEQIQELSPRDGVSYVAEITAECGRLGKTQDVCSASAKINVTAAPIGITFDGNEATVVPDDRNFTLTWQYQGVSANAADKTWWYEVIDTKTGELILSSEPSSDFSVRSLTIDKNLLRITDRETTLKRIFSITVYAANDPSLGCSAQSVLLYVYNTDAIGIAVRDFPKKSAAVHAVTKTGDNAYRMDYRVFAGETLSDDNKTLDLAGNGLSISELQDDLRLASIIRLDSGKYTWGMISDKLYWNILQNGNGNSLYMSIGGGFNDITKKNYAAYMPTEEFVLPAEHTGQMTLEVTHAESGIKKQVTVDVADTMEDELYLFLFRPAAVTQMQYINGLGQQVTVSSDASGQLALYEPNGIRKGTTLYLSSEKGGAAYIGAFKEKDLKTGESNFIHDDSPYSVRIYNLKKAGQADIYLVKPDGSPLANTTVTVRGGLYYNETYMPKADLYSAPDELGDPNNDENRSNGLDGASYTTDKNGKFSVYFNLDQAFDGVDSSTMIEADKLKFAFEITFANAEYVPEVFEVTCDNPFDRYTNKVLELTETNAKNRGFFLHYHTLDVFKDGESIGVTDVDGSETYVGPNSVYTRVDIAQRYTIWDEDACDEFITRDPVTGYADVSDNIDSLSIGFCRSNGTVLPAQEYALTVYEFSSVLLAKLYLRLDSNTFRNWLSSNQSDKARVEVRKNGKAVWNYIPTYRIINDIGTEKPKDDPKMEDLARDAAESVGEALDLKSMLTGLIPGGDMISKGLTFFSGVSGITSPIDLLLLPTNDPTVFDVVVTVGEDPDDEDDGGDGYSLDHEDAFNTDDIKEALGYKKDDDKDDDEDDDNTVEFNFYGALVARATYDPKTGFWSLQFTGGTVGAGVKISYEYTGNFIIGPAPVTVSFGASAKLNAKLNPSSGKGPDGDDVSMLSTISVVGGIEAFAGLGFDLSCFAVKFGATGSLSLGVTIKTLMGDSGFHIGEKMDLDGMVGIKLKLKILFIKYEETFASASFHDECTWDDYEEIEEYWEGETVNGSLYSATLDNGTLTLAIESEPECVGTLMSDGDDLLTDPMLTGDEEPVISADGEIVAYLNGGIACWAKKQGNAYVPQGPIDPATAALLERAEPLEGNAGNYYIDLAGSSGRYAAVWSQQTVDVMDGRSSVTFADISAAMNSTDIYAAVYENGNWTVERLTDDMTPDMAPQVAVNGDKIIVAWRNVYSSGEDFMAFDVRDDVCFRVFDGAAWSDTRIVYNGAAGKVKALDTAIASDGAAVITYTVSTVDDTTIEGFETFYTYINGSDTMTVRATTDENLDENAKVAVITDNGAERFILAWYHMDDSGSDVKLLAVNADGTIDAAFPESVAKLGDLGITSSFALVSEPGRGIDSLAAVWTRNRTDAESKTQNTAVYGVKFWENDGKIGVTPRQTLAETDDYVIVDSFGAYVVGDTLHALLAESDYSEGQAVEVDRIDVDELIGHIVKREDFDDEASYNAAYEKLKASFVDGSDEVKNTIAVLACGEQAKLQTVSYRFREKLDVSVKPIKTSIVPGLDVPVTFELTNSGISPLKNVSVMPFGETIDVIEPGETVTLTVSHTLPTESTAMDLDYVISAETPAIESVTGTVRFNAPEIGIREAKVVSAENGERRINVRLENPGLIDFEGNDKRVGVALYADPDKTELLARTVLDDDMAMIDAGARVVPFTLDMCDFADDNGRLPERGVTVYVEATVEDADGEKVNSDISRVKLAAIGQDEWSFSSVKSYDDGKLTVTLTATNNTLEDVVAENIMIDLCDESGMVLRRGHSYTGDDSSFVSVGRESSVTLVYSFDDPDGVLDRNTAYTEARVTDKRFVADSNIVTYVGDYVGVDIPDENGYVVLPVCDEYGYYYEFTIDGQKVDSQEILISKNILIKVTKRGVDCEVIYTGDYEGTEIVRYGESAVLPVCEEEGYHYEFFKGYNELWDSRIVTEDRTYITVVKYVTCDKKRTVTFVGDYNGTAEVNSRNSVTLPVCETEGYRYEFTVDDWRWEPENIFDDVTVTVTTERIICAVWFSGDYTNTVMVYYGDNVKLPLCNEEGYHYEFTSRGLLWSGKHITNSVDVTVTKVEGAYEAYCTVTFVGAYNGSATVPYGGRLTLPESEDPHYYYMFYIDGTYKPPVFFDEITEDLTVTTELAGIWCNVSYYGDYYDTQTVHYGDSVTLPECYDNGYRYDFTVDDEPWDGTFVEGDTDVLVTRVYDPTAVSYMVYFYYDYYGTVWVKAGGDVELPVCTDEGYEYEITCNGELWDGKNVQSDCDVKVARYPISAKVCTITYVGDYTGTASVKEGRDAVLPVCEEPNYYYEFYDTNGYRWWGYYITDDATVTVKKLHDACRISYTGEEYWSTSVPYGGDAVLPRCEEVGYEYTFSVKGEPWDGKNVTEDLEVLITKVEAETLNHTVTYIGDYTGTVLVKDGFSARRPYCEDYDYYYQFTVNGAEWYSYEIYADVTVTVTKLRYPCSVDYWGDYYDYASVPYGGDVELPQCDMYGYKFEFYYEDEDWNEVPWDGKNVTKNMSIHVVTVERTDDEDTLYLDGGYGSFAVKPYGKDCGKGIVVAAFYRSSSQKRLISVKTYDLAKGETPEGEYDIYSIGYMKVFWVSDLDSMSPLCRAVAKVV